MALDGVDRDAQARGDLAVRLAVGEQAQDLGLARGERSPAAARECAGPAPRAVASPSVAPAGPATNATSRSTTRSASSKNRLADEPGSTSSRPPGSARASSAETSNGMTSRRRDGGRAPGSGTRAASAVTSMSSAAWSVARAMAGVVAVRNQSAASRPSSPVGPAEPGVGDRFDEGVPVALDEAQQRLRARARAWDPSRATRRRTGPARGRAPDGGRPRRSRASTEW